MHPVRFLAGLAALVVLLAAAGTGWAQKKELDKLKAEDFRAVIQRQLDKEKKVKEPSPLQLARPVFVINDALAQRLTYDGATGTLTVRVALKPNAPADDLAEATQALKQFIIDQAVKASLVTAAQAKAGDFKVEIRAEPAAPPEKAPPPPDRKVIPKPKGPPPVPAEPEPPVPGEPPPVKRPRPAEMPDELPPPVRVGPDARRERLNGDRVLPSVPYTYYIPSYSYYPYRSGCGSWSYYPVVSYYPVTYGAAAAAASAARGSRESYTALAADGLGVDVVMVGREHGNGRPRVRRDPDVPFWRGYNLYWQRQYPAALAEFVAAVELRDNDARYWYYKALAERAVGLEAEALASLRRAAEWRSRNSPALDAVLGSLERVQGPDRLFINSVRVP
jgi:hypothetical protein